MYLHISDVDLCGNRCEHYCEAQNKCTCHTDYILASNGISCLKCASITDDNILPTWNVAICDKDDISLPLVCSGSLLNDQWVLTSASCVCKNKKIDNLVVKSGKTHTCSLLESNETEHSIQDIYCYSDFRPTNFDFDLALIKLNTSYASKEIHEIRPVCIKRTEIQLKDQVVYFGWGNIVSGAPNNAVLNRSMSTVVHRRKCTSSLGEGFKNVFFCTTANTSEACAGNPGSGVVSVSTIDNKLLSLQGVISKSTNKCGQFGSFIANSKVQSRKILKWIRRVFNLH